ncbi:MAG: acyl-CoA reductase, partial [Bradymonadaceae bacterium]
IAEVCGSVGEDTKVIGYGHRVSFALVMDSTEADLGAWARGLALDTVLWHQSGCFSCRAVIFCGPDERATLFGRMLAAAIEQTQIELDAATLDDVLLANRAQAIGLARLKGPILDAGLGWVQPTPEPFRGEQPSPHVVSLHRIDTLDDLPRAIGLAPHHLQGAALAIAPEDPRQDAARTKLIDLGVTRVCAPGELQAPPANWPHDGRPNVLDWLP